MNATQNRTHSLRLSHGVSRGAETYGYAIVTLTDETTGQRYRCNGGGYDMVGTVFGNWLADNYQDELVSLYTRVGVGGFYGLHRYQEDGPVTLSGACGIESMQAIARAIGLTLERTYRARGVNRGETTGWVVTRGSEADVSS